MSLVTQLPQSKSKPPQSPERATGSRQVSAQSKRTAPPAKKRPPAAGKKSAPAKQAGDAGAAGTEKSQTLGPERDPRFKRVASQLKKGAAGLKKHPPASKKASEAQAAAQPPANEKLAGAKANQVDAMKEAKAEKPQPNAFLALLRAEIKKVMPANLDEADSFLEGSDKAELESAVTGKVNEQKDEATGEIKSASTQAPDTSSVEGKEVMPMPADPAAPAPVVRGNEAMPAPKPDKEISQQQKKIDAQKMMDDAEITEPQMKKANDPRFSAVLSAKSNVQKTADASPGKYRAGEKGMLGRAMAQAQTLSKQGVAMLLGVKTKSGAAVKSRQEAAKEKDEKRRKEVADTIEGIYNKTKEEVDLKLSTLESEVLSTFQAGIERNLTALKEDTRKEVEDYKDERYSGIRGKARWIRDQFRPLVPGVKEIIQRNLTVFTDAMDALVVRIADLVESKLTDAKKEIDKGQASIKSYVESLPKDLQAVGKAAEKEMSSRFDDMRKGVDERQNDLAQKLAAKYKEAQDQATAIAKKIEDENKGAVYKLAEAIGEVIKMLAEFKDKLMAALRKGWAVIKQIINDPIGFLSNLLAAIKQGFNQFRERFLVHLERGFIKWLFGAMAGSGVELPKDLSLPSILKMVMQVLGLTYERMRAKAVKLIGERNVAILEKVFEYVKALITEGPAALWEKIKADLSNLKDMVIGAIQRWILTQIIKSAVTKLVTMFNPVGAIIQALITIYNTVMFVIENASRLLEFVEAVVNSVSEIASGAISKAANWIETALGNLIPIVIGFLARLIGLGGIAGAVKDIIKKVQGAVDRAIDKLIEKIIGTVKKIGGKLTGKDSKPDERTEKEKLASLKDAVSDAQRILKAPNTTPDKVKAALPSLKTKYKLSAVELVKTGTNKYKVLVKVNPEDDTEEKEFDPSTLQVNDPIVFRRERYKADPKLADADPYIWSVGIVTAVDVEKKRFSWKSANLKKEITGVYFFKDFDVKWKKGHVAQVNLKDAELEEQNKKEVWDTFETARKVLNHRHHNSQVNVPGKQWEHIMEKSAGGAHSSDNLALTDSTINQQLNVWFGTKAFASHEVTPPLRGTGGKTVRNFLKGITDPAIHQAWKLEAYKDIGISLHWKNSERGKWQELD